MNTACLGCAGDTKCAPCAARLGQGALPGLNPAVSSAMPAFNVAADLLGVPDLAQGLINTAVGVSTPVTPEQERDFARLVNAWAEIDTALYTNARPELRQRIRDARQSWGAFSRLWNAAQRDPEELRRQVQTAEQIVRQIEAEASKKRPFTLPKKPARKSLSKALVYTAVGVGVAAAGGAIALIARR